MSELSIRAARAILPGGELESAEIRVSDGVIERIGTVCEGGAATVDDYGDGIICPGFVDIHIHGVAGRLPDESADAVIATARYLLSVGVTSFLPTAMTLQGARNCAEIAAGNGIAGGAKVPGFRMEGPFLAPKNLGGGADSTLLEPDIVTAQEIIDAAAGTMCIMDVAPELPGAEPVVRKLRLQGIVVAAGHTNATAAQLRESQSWGVSHSTHLFNVMPPFSHRAAGAAGAILASRDMTGEIIADGIHLCDEAMMIACKCLGPRRLALISDMTLGGLDDGEYSRGEFSIVVRDGVARFKGADETAAHSIAGSTFPVLRGIATMCRLGIPLSDAVRMASATPAAIAGIDGECGSLESGRAADITVLRPDLSVAAVYLDGKKVFVG